MKTRNARIIYKNGCEGRNRLESIEGIEIDLLNGRKALIYPKYSEEVMLPKENFRYYGQEPDTEIAALRETESDCLTNALHDCGSPAAAFVHKFRSEKYGEFYLPTLLAAMEIQDKMPDIDELAETIDGADLLSDFTSGVWSCSKYGENDGWVADCGFAAGYGMDDSFVAVPFVLL